VNIHQKACFLVRYRPESAENLLHIGCQVDRVGKDYVVKSPIRQTELLRCLDKKFGIGYLPTGEVYLFLGKVDTTTLFTRKSGQQFP
jgi:hypothetical protein